jgi:hypothetical protein
MKSSKQIVGEPRVRRYYIFNEKVVNKEECVVQGRSSINKGDYDQVEIHMHGTDVLPCPGFGKRTEIGKCFRFGKGIQ